MLSVALFGGYIPVFSYHDDTLRFARCVSSDCSGLSPYEVVDNGSLGAGACSAIAVKPNNQIEIAYQKSVTVSGGGTGLYVAECEDSSCHDSDRFEIDLQPGLTTGEDVAIVIGTDGGAVIAYFDQSTLKLKVAKCAPESCRGPGDRLFADGFEAAP